MSFSQCIHLCIPLFIHWFTHPLSIHPTIYLSNHPFLHASLPPSFQHPLSFNPPLHPFTYPPSTNFFIHLNFHPFPIYPRIYPSSIHHPLPVTTMPSIHLSIYSIIHPSNHPFISLSAQSDIIHPSIIHHSSIHDSYRHTLSPIHPFFSLLSNWVPDTVQGRLIIVLWARISQCLFCATHFQSFHLCFPPQFPNRHHAIKASQDWVSSGHLQVTLAHLWGGKWKGWR